jgi:glucosamine 6-phosphate synthetase-like amidotransferase/phosphosugar isomerase protein
MCGLFGSITNKTNLSKDRLEQINNAIGGLAITMETRGSKSSGIYAIKDGKGTLLKTLKKASSWIDDEDYIKLISMNNDIIIGHTRLDSVGEVNLDNAHPFVKGNIIGCHNGHVDNYKFINEDVKVDSEVIFQLLNETHNSYTKALGRLRGTFAVSWVNMKLPDRVYFVCHNNPLHFARVEKLQTYFWASEIEALKAVMTTLIDAGEITYYDLEKNEDKVLIIKQDLSYKLHKVEFNTYQRDTRQNFRNFGEDDEISLIADSVRENTTLGDEISDDCFILYDMFSSDMERYDFVKIVSQRSCVMCREEVTRTREGGFWYDFTLYGMICKKCSKDEELGLDDTGYWVGNKEYGEFLVEFYSKKDIDSKGEKINA